MNRRSWKESDPEAPSSSSANSTFNSTDFEEAPCNPVVDFSGFINKDTGALQAIRIPLLGCFSAEASAERWREFADNLKSQKSTKKVEKKRKIVTSEERKQMEEKRKQWKNDLLQSNGYSRENETTDESLLEEEDVKLMDVEEPLPMGSPVQLDQSKPLVVRFKRSADDILVDQPQAKMPKIYFDMEDINSCDLSSSAFRRIVCDNLEFWSDIADRIRDLDEKLYEQRIANKHKHNQFLPENINE